MNASSGRIRRKTVQQSVTLLANFASLVQLWQRKNLWSLQD